ncbi:Glycosyltransferase, GT2 family [Pedococcus dokdonensis]|uniref:Glycosyltransferase, GT2 family n=1 Tax=Pedococcus dokdonensis TaxID=443156 RepID=A0A1H0RCX5_9MICO|nr:glycosyltransferase family 2 protein [Pedococcus dokdonensis]SDP26758.1 Glycosyltransferase, GT2 family [Pedococcus dokdonensis]
MTTLSVVVVGFGDEPDLPACLAAIRADLAPGDEVVLVDNGITTPPPLDGTRLVTSGRNGGFAAGCHLGADATDGDVLVFVNSDAVVQPGSLEALRTEASRPEVGLVTGLVVMADRPEVVNAAGNPVHFLGISWAGGYGEDVDRHRQAREVASVSGALFAVRREVWDRLGGLDPAYFLYHEDADLSIRCRLAGLKVSYHPGAVATHAYSFAKNPQKMFLLERNRLVTVLTTYPRPLLVRVLPAILVTEPLLLVMAAMQGWAGSKLRSWAWLLSHAPRLAARRRRVQPDATQWRALAARLEPRIQQDVTAAPAAMSVLNAALAAYWTAVARPARSA